MIKDFISILKRSAVAVALAIGILAGVSSSSGSKATVGLQTTVEVASASNPFEEDISNLSPKQAAEFWNNWGAEYGHNGPMTNVFVCYLNAVRLMPHEPTYHRNLATSLFMYRKDAKDFLNVTEEQVFSMALREYRKARILDPENHELAKELALMHYAIRPFRAEEALTEWHRVMILAEKISQVDAEEAYLNIARVNYMAARYSEAQKWLLKVNCIEHSEIRNVLWQRVTESAHLHPHGANN